jgi:YidC/Oxa1 family membrane protein insertase
LSTGSTEEAVRQINEIVYWPFLQIEELDLWFFGINLASKPSQWQTEGWWLLAIPLITGVLQYYQMKSTPGMGAPASAAVDTKKSKKKQEKKEDATDMAASMQKQMLYIFPVMIAFFSYSMPAGLALYWNTFSLMTIWSQKKTIEAVVPTKPTKKSKE